MTSYAGFWGLALSWLWQWHVGFAFCCHLLRVYVCLGLGQCFRGSTECAGDGFLGTIELILSQTEGS